MEKILVTKSSIPPIEEYISEISDLWESHWLTNMGPKHVQLQKELCDYLGVENIELLTNGHMSLELTLQAMDLSGEVITTPFTFVSTTHAIIRNGLKPVFCDINEDNFTIDTEKIEDLITEKTTAILPVHVYGNICNIEEIDRIARKHNLKVLYDAAHAFGESYYGKGVGNFGDASAFSFHATKVFNTIEGGAVSFKNKKLGERLYDLKNFGIHGPEDINAIGANAKMNEFCAAMGLCNLRHVDEEIEKRKSVYEKYRSLLKGAKGIRLNTIQKGVKSNYAYFPIIVDERFSGVSRDNVKDALEKEGVFTRKYFYPLTNSIGALKGKYNVEKTPVAKFYSDRVLSLPMYADLEESNVERICSIILSLIK